jgi:hypothetical protein
MKTPYRFESKKYPGKKWIVAAMVPVMGLLIACGKTNSNEIDKNNAFQNCTNCSNFTPVGSGNEFLRSMSQDTYGMLQVNLSLMYQIYGANISNYNVNYAAFVSSYSGMVAAVGSVVLNQNFTMNVNTQENSTYCLMPKGEYTARTLQAGQWSNLGVSGLKLELFGPANVVLSSPRGQISAANPVTNFNATGRLQGNAVVESINGNPCQVIFNIQ